MGIGLIIIGIVLLWWLFPGEPVTLVLLAVAALFLFGFRRPVWAMAALLVSQLTVTSYMVETPFGVAISLRLLLLLLVGFVLWYHRSTIRFELGPGVRRIIIPAACY